MMILTAIHEMDSALPAVTICNTIHFNISYLEMVAATHIMKQINEKLNLILKFCWIFDLQMNWVNSSLAPLF